MVSAHRQRAWSITRFTDQVDVGHLIVFSIAGPKPPEREPTIAWAAPVRDEPSLLSSTQPPG
jgi:hypothetical protein